MPVAYALAHGTTVLDPLGTLVAILGGGWMAGMLAQALRLPRVVGMIFFGMVLYPAASDVVVAAQTGVNPNGGGQLLPGVVWPANRFGRQTTSPGALTPGGYGSCAYSAAAGLNVCNIAANASVASPNTYNVAPQGLSSPASVIRTVALLIALARGSVGLSLDTLRATPVTIALLATVPYAVELLAEGAVAPIILPDASGLTASPPCGFAVMGMMPYVASSLWAALSPSLVIPNMLALVDSRGPVGPGDAASPARRALIAASPSNVILVAAPLEVATALITYGSLLIAASATTSNPPNELNTGAAVDGVGLIVLWVLFAIALGATVAAALRVWRDVRALPAMLRQFQAPTPGEQAVAFFAAFFFSYVVCQDAYIPKLNNFVCALSMALSARVLCPGLAETLAAPLKFAWVTIEVLLFVLTGFVIRNGIDASSVGVSIQVVAVLLIGSLARLAADLVCALVWQLGAEARARAAAGGSAAWAPAALSWRMVLFRAAFAWAVTSPKATVQAAVGGDVTTHNANYGLIGVLPADAVSAACPAAYTSPVGAFVSVSCAFSILINATLGSILTWTLGVFLLTKVFNLHDAQGRPLPPDVLVAAGIDPRLGYHVPPGAADTPAKPAAAPAGILQELSAYCCGCLAALQARRRKVLIGVVPPAATTNFFVAAAGPPPGIAAPLSDAELVPPPPDDA